MFLKSVLSFLVIVLHKTFHEYSNVFNNRWSLTSFIDYVSCFDEETVNQIKISTKKITHHVGYLLLKFVPVPQ